MLYMPTGVLSRQEKTGTSQPWKPSLERPGKVHPDTCVNILQVSRYGAVGPRLGLYIIFPQKQENQGPPIHILPAIYPNYYPNTGTLTNLLIHKLFTQKPLCQSGRAHAYADTCDSIGVWALLGWMSPRWCVGHLDCQMILQAVRRSSPGSALTARQHVACSVFMQSVPWQAATFSVLHPGSTMQAQRQRLVFGVACTVALLLSSVL